MEQKTCFKCGAVMKVSTRTGKLYCSELCWKNEDQPEGLPKKVDGNLMVFDAVQDFRQEFNERMDKLAEYLAKKLS